MMGRDHAGVRRMELPAQAFLFQELLNFIDPLRDDKARTFAAFREKIPHRPRERAGHANPLPVFVEQRKMAVDPANPLHIAAAHDCRRVVDGHPPNLIGRRVQQIHQTLHGKMRDH